MIASTYFHIVTVSGVVAAVPGKKGIVHPNFLLAKNFRKPLVAKSASERAKFGIRFGGI